MLKLKYLTLVLSVLLSRLAFAAGGESGTDAVGEMQVTGLQFFGLIGALAVLGVVVWLVAKYLNK